jgi:ribonuclease P protein component
LAPAGSSFPRTARLLSKADYQRVFDDPYKAADRYFTILARPHPGRPARLGLAISRKCARRAVDRNRLKRLVREAFRQQRRHLDEIDFVVLCRSGAAGQDHRDLLNRLAAHFQRIRHRLCGTS